MSNIQKGEIDNLKQAVTIISEHNQWRQGNDGYDMKDPKEITLALDTLCNNYKYLFACNFFTRLKMFIDNVNVCDQICEEEKEMILNVCNHFIEPVNIKIEVIYKQIYEDIAKFEKELEDEATLVTEAVHDVITIAGMNSESVAFELIRTIYPI